jgi:alkylated DNA repair protein alkB family protein 8
VSPARRGRHGADMGLPPRSAGGAHKVRLPAVLQLPDHAIHNWRGGVFSVSILSAGSLDQGTCSRTGPCCAHLPRFLWVGGVRGMTLPQLEELFAPFGRPSVVLPPAISERAHEGESLEHPTQPSPAQAPPTHGLQQTTPTVAIDSHEAAASAAPPIASYHAFLAFEAEGDAAAAAAAVPHNAPWPAAGGRRILTAFSLLSADKVCPRAASAARMRVLHRPAACQHAALSWLAWRLPLSQERSPPRPVALCAEDTGVPGLHLLPDFVSGAEEEALLAALGSLPAAGGGHGLQVG